MPEDIGLLERRQEAEAAALGQILQRHGEPLPSPEHSEAFGAFFDRFGDARVVLLGEATHGTSEFYRARAAAPREGRCDRASIPRNRGRPRCATSRSETA